MEERYTLWVFFGYFLCLPIDHKVQRFAQELRKNLYLFWMACTWYEGSVENLKVLELEDKYLDFGGLKMLGFEWKCFRNHCTSVFACRTYWMNLIGIYKQRQFLDIWANRVNDLEPKHYSNRKVFRLTMYRERPQITSKILHVMLHFSLVNDYQGCSLGILFQCFAVEL